QVIALSDQNPPTITCPTGGTFQCLSGLPTPPTGVIGFLAPGRMLDDTNVVCSSVDGPLLGGFCGGTVTRIHKVIDVCGNESICTQVFTVRDTIPPTISCAVGATIECPSTPSFNTPSVSDLCDPNPILSFIDVTNAGPCAQSYSVTRTWTAKDRCNNAASCTQTITVVDTTAP